MREALTDLSHLHTLAELQPAAGASESQRSLLFLLIRVAHLDPTPLSCHAERPRSGFHSSINHRTRAKSGDLLRDGDQLAAQPAIPYRYVYHMIATKDRAHLRCGQNDRNGQTTRYRTHLPAAPLSPIER